MTCSYCGTHLPAGALFCGECGRSTRDRATAASAAPSAQNSQPVVAEAELIAPVHMPSVIPDTFLTDIPVDYDRSPAAAAEPVPAPAPVPEPAPEPLPAQEPVLEPAAADIPEQVEGSWCAQCGALLSESEIFCGECGFVRSDSQQPRDTAILDPFRWDVEPTPYDEAPPATLPPATPPPVAPPAFVSPTPPPSTFVAPPAPVSPPAPPSAPRVASASHRADQAAFDERDHAAREPFVDDRLEDDMEQTRIVAPGAAGDRFILQFSTGESVSVTGSGLLGRNPLAEPGEYYEALVAISDPGKSVSKTHLEFGQDGGAFWISDRYSGNGTLFREPERTARRCEPGKRYRIARGTRVEIGEQFFIVS